ncbi:hypothetical protein VDS66_004412 [Pseudomonas aeruginosa]|nr:hypothetical protein [Pseudomonas aeruginosa]
MDEAGNLIRLYPVPFRLVTDDQRFSKWQWIEASIEKSSNDHRPESHKIGVDTIQPQDIIPTSKAWIRRREMLSKLPIYDSFEALEQARQNSNVTLGLIKPERIIGLEIRKAASESWTDEELEKLERLQRQPGLFDQDDVKASIKRLEKVPFDFYYSYESVLGNRLANSPLSTQTSSDKNGWKTKPCPQVYPLNKPVSDVGHAEPASGSQSTMASLYTSAPHTP